MTDITRDLGRFVASLKFEQIPKDALEVIYTGFADCVWCDVGRQGGATHSDID
jgi:hypothetical protein